ncbi:Flp pilus assembly complex ATPase component TadA [Pseudomonas cichorii]|nr:Flp pilus assembly complex ATPase component TadA [Pseudomonas cichorii]
MEALRIEPSVDLQKTTQPAEPVAALRNVHPIEPPKYVRQVLTAEGGAWGDIKQDLRQLMALVEAASLGEPAQLFVSTQHLSDHYVMAFQDRLDRANVSFIVQPSTMSEIKALYQENVSISSSNPSATNSTQRQQEVIRIIGAAHERGASDVHFIVGHEITRILFREDGILTEFGQIQSSIGNELCSSLYNSMCDVKSEGYYQPEIPQDGRVSRTFVDQLGLYGARVATRPLVDGPLMVLRLLFDDESKQSLDDLGFHDVQNQLFRRLLSLPYGVILITGPTGSGKSKTLQVLINKLSQDVEGTKHILTVEDPPEYPIEANQSPLGSNETWDEAITNTMRLDPDVLMYGEIRDLASAQAALRGGMTGHLVLSTLHTNNAVAAIPRLIDMGAAESLVTDPALIAGLINQSLLPALCQHCRIPAKENFESLDQGLVNRLKKLTKLDQVFLLGPGCQHCRGMGVSGRTAASEVLLPTHDFMETLRKNGPSAARNYWVKHLNGITKIAHTLMKVNAGLVDPRMAETIVGPLDFDSYVIGTEPGENHAQ